MRKIKKGATSQSVYFEVLDSTSTTGGRKTGLVWNTASLTATYVRNQGSATAIALATLAAANSAWSSGGFKEVDAALVPGLYRLDVPDAAFATGVDSVTVTIFGAADMAQASHDIQLDDNTAKDVYDRLGAPAGASIAADLAAIENQTDDIGAAGAGLTAVPWNAAWDAEVESEAQDAITASALATAANLALVKAVTDLLPNAGALTALGNLDTTVSSRLATAGYTAAPTATQNADAFLDRDMAAGADTQARSPRNALRAIRNKVSRAGAVVTVTKEDDATPAWTAALTTDAAAVPITEIDPA